MSVVRALLLLPRRFGVGLIVLYQRTLGRLLGGRCRFHPTCSEYAAQAIRLNGLAVGSAQAAWRLVRCGPWTAGGIDYPSRVGRAVPGADRREELIGRDASPERTAAHG